MNAHQKGKGCRRLIAWFPASLTAFAVVLIVGAGLAANSLADGAPDLAGLVILSPDCSADQWPPKGSPPQAGDLAPKHTATITIQVNAGLGKDNIEYRLKENSLKVVAQSSDPNALWTGTDMSYMITNTAIDHASAGLTASCTWTPVSQGGSGGGGDAPPDFEEVGGAGVNLLDSKVDWTVPKTLQAADGVSTLGWSAAFFDEDGRSINVTVNSIASDPDSMDPQDAAWNVEVATHESAGTPSLSGTARSSDGSRGSLKLMFNDGSTEKSISPKMTFFDITIKEIDFTSDHNVLTDYDKDFTGAGGNLYEPRGWKIDDKDQVISNPITHTQGQKLNANVIVIAKPMGVLFNLRGECEKDGAFSFAKAGVTSTAQLQTIPVIADAKLKEQIDFLDETIAWKAVVPAGADTIEKEAADTEHQVYALWHEPLGGGTPTVHRVRKITAEWAAKAASPEAIGDAVGKAIIFPLSGGHSIRGPEADLLNEWAAAEPDIGGDCGTVVTLMKSTLDMLGVKGAILKSVLPRHAAWGGYCVDLGDGVGENRVAGDDDTRLLFGVGTSQNAAENCCVFDGKWWMGGISKDFTETVSNSLEVLITAIGPLPPGSNSQYWTDDDYYRNNVQYPAGSPEIFPK